MPAATKVAAGASTTEYRPAARRTIRSRIIWQDESYPRRRRDGGDRGNDLDTPLQPEAWARVLERVGECRLRRQRREGSEWTNGSNRTTGATRPSNSVATTVNGQTVTELLLQEPTLAVPDEWRIARRRPHARDVYPGREPPRSYLVRSGPIDAKTGSSLWTPSV
jgi:hypothetical protein